MPLKIATGIAQQHCTKKGRCKLWRVIPREQNKLYWLVKIQRFPFLHRKPIVSENFHCSASTICSSPGTKVENELGKKSPKIVPSSLLVYVGHCCVDDVTQVRFHWTTKIFILPIFVCHKFTKNTIFFQVHFQVLCPGLFRGFGNLPFRIKVVYQRTQNYVCRQNVVGKFAHFGLGNLSVTFSTLYVNPV